ncbi:MAG: rRNA methylase [Clostridiales bacterium]|nr:rRNA methylase [Clostridiales bacterium]
MFKYISDVSNIAHSIIKNHSVNFNTALDATLGNGYDTDFLSSLFDTVYAFDIQEQCIINYKIKSNNKIILINDSHENVDKYVKTGLDCAMYNLGFLPGGNKELTTTYESTLKSIEKTLLLLNPQGLLTIAIYPGHPAGRLEKEYLLDYCKKLPKNKYAVLYSQFINRENTPPELLIIEKNEGF